MAPKVQPVPEHLHTVTPRLVFRDEAAAALRFYTEAFGAEVLAEPIFEGDRVIHAEMRIGDSVVYVTDEGDGEGRRARIGQRQGHGDHGAQHPQRRRAVEASR